MSRKSGYRFSDKDVGKRKNPDAGNFLQRGGDRWAVARNGEALDARSRARNQGDVPLDAANGHIK